MKSIDDLVKEFEERKLSETRKNEEEVKRYSELNESIRRDHLNRMRMYEVMSSGRRRLDNYIDDGYIYPGYFGNQ